MINKFINLGLISSVVAFTSSNAFAVSENCNVDPNLLQAHYSVIHMAGDKTLEEHMVLTRHDGLVAHTDEATHITDVWFKHKNQRVALTRYFDDHERAIEYEPFDLNQQQGAIDWGNKYQLISDQTLKSLELKGSNGESCEQVQTYVGVIDGVDLKLEWQPALNSVVSLSVSKGHESRLIKRTELETKAQKIEQFFDVRSAFLSTDYTDIGDNESDPFLLKMVNLGFVEHGAEGFYDADGNKMGGGHGHHHH